MPQPRSEILETPVYDLSDAVAIRYSRVNDHVPAFRIPKGFDTVLRASRQLEYQRTGSGLSTEL